MNQDVFTLIIVFLAAAYAVFSLIKTLLRKSTGVCDSNCSCSAKRDFKTLLDKKQKVVERKFQVRL